MWRCCFVFQGSQHRGRNKSAILIPSHEVFCKVVLWSPNAELRASHCSHRSCCHTTELHFANSAVFLIPTLSSACPHLPPSVSLCCLLLVAVFCHIGHSFLYIDFLKQLHTYFRSAHPHLFSHCCWRFLKLEGLNTDDVQSKVKFMGCFATCCESLDF